MLVSWRHSLKLAAKVQNCAWRLRLLFHGLFDEQSELLENCKRTKLALKYFRINTEHQIINGENWPCFKIIVRNDFANDLGPILVSWYLTLIHIPLEVFLAAYFKDISYVPQTYLTFTNYLFATF